MQLDKKFEELIKGLVKAEKKVGDAMLKQTDPRPWCNFAGDDIPSEQRATDKKEKTLNTPLDRNDATEEYVKKRSDSEADARDVAVPKMIVDYLAAMQRDKRMQWRSRIRMIAHASGRRAGNGQDNGPLRVNTLEYFSRAYLKAEAKE